MFVGRDEELRELEAAIAAARARGTYVALVGEPGIGKTRLAEEAAARAAAAGFRVAWGRCWEAGGAPSLWPWIEALRELGIADGWERGAGEQFEIFDGVMRALRQAAETQPIALVLDDLHAADRSSLLLLQFVARQLRFARVCLIATYRDVEARLREDFAALLAKPAREGKALVLDRLDREEVALLAAERADLVDALYRTSEGNPLFVHELLQLVDLQGDAVAIPDGIRAVIAERVRLVGETTRAALEVASVLGREFDAAVIAELRGGCVLDDAVRAGLVAATAAGRYRFGHVRIRDVLYDEIGAERRAMLHAAVAQLLARRGADASAIAHHWFHAGVHDPQTRELAVAAAVRAADEASARLAFDDAAALLERAHANVEAGPRRIELAIALGTALIRAGRPDDGQRLCADAAREARASGAAELVARAALAYGLVYRFGRSDARMVGLLEDALAALPEADSPLRAQLLGRLAGALQPADVITVPIVAARRALEVARRTGDPETLASVLVSAGSALQDVTDAGERLPNNEELVRLAMAKGDLLLAARGQLRLVFDHLELGNVEAADASFREHEALIAEHRNPRLHWPSALYRALRADMDGRFAEADDHVAQARRLAERANDTGARVTLAIHAACTAVVRDSLAALHEAGPLLAEWGYHPGIAQMLAALVACRLGRLDEARARATWDATPNWAIQASAGTCIAEVAACVKPEPQIFADLAPYAARGRTGVWSMTAIVSLGPIARPLAALAAALGRWDEAEQLARQALDAALREGHVPILARTRFEWGSALLRRGRPEGKQLVDEAHATAEQLGMTGLVAACRGIAAPVIAVAPPRGETAPVLAIERDGDTWVCSLADERVRVRDSRGMQMIAELVARTGDDVHVLDLSGAGSVDTGDAGEVLDRTALERYKRRIAELGAELAEAEDDHDLGRSERLREELEALEDEVARAVGLGGRTRRAGSAVERARSNVQRRIKSAIQQVEKLSPALGIHLARSVRTGAFCSYVPRPG